MSVKVQMVLRRSVVFAVLAISASTVDLPPFASAEEKPVEVQAVDAFNAIFGSHPGMRAVHAKGIVVEGSFQASPEARQLSIAPHFQGEPVPVTIRFSDATGLPEIPDGSADANPHGMAIKFILPNGDETDIVANSLKQFPVANVTEFRDLLLAVAASKPDSPKPTKLDEFLASHPAAGRALATTATPASFATQQYNGINAFTFANQAGEKITTRYRIVPAEGVVHLQPEEAAKRQPDFLIDEIKQRLENGPVRFGLMVQVAEAGDPTNDATVPWPDERKLVQLGTITITQVVKDSRAAEKQLLFRPGQLTDGIEPSDDPLILSRDTAYAESFTRRGQ